MVAGSDGDALRVDDLGDVVRVDAVKVEADDACPPFGRRAVERQAGNLREAPPRVRRELADMIASRPADERATPLPQVGMA